MKILVKTDPDNWDNSQLVAQGLTKDGCQINSAYTTLRAGDLPPPYRDIWHGVVDHFRGDGLDDGALLCVLAEAVLVPVAEPAEDAIDEVLTCSLTTYWQWGDGRITQHTAHIDDPAVIALTQHLLHPDTYTS